MPYAALYADCEVLNNPTEQDFKRVASESKLPGLIIFGYKFESFEALSVFSRLEILKIQGASKLQRLDGIEQLLSLREFVLSTPTGSDGSGVFIGVESFAPLERVQSLERLILLNVRPADLDLSPIMRMTQLRDVDIGGVPEFAIEHYAKLSIALPHTEGRCLQPYVIIKGIGYCKKCKAQQMLLNGTPPRARKWICPKCNAKLLAAHLAKWEALGGRPYEAR
jgi:hypothetical protein